MISSLGDLYAAIRTVRDRLRAGDGDGARWAYALDGALHAGSTSGEIMDELWRVLTGLRESTAAKRFDLEVTVEDALAFLASVKRPPSR